MIINDKGIINLRTIEKLKSLKSDFIAQIYAIIRTPNNIYSF